MTATNFSGSERAVLSQVLDAALRKETDVVFSSETTTMPTPRQVAEVMRRVDAAFGVTGKVTVEDVVHRHDEIQRDRRQLATLPAGITQRTPEWYQARHTLMTASDIAQALGFGKFDTQEAFFEKKVPPLVIDSDKEKKESEDDDEKPSPFAVLPHFKWGVMFEDVAAALYQARTGCRIHEFGLLVHPQHPRVPLGASPDGITDMGVMVEIKCPYRRKISGEVMLQYYYQIQGQLEVCGLRHCDYLECEFTEYRNAQDFEVDVLDASDGVSERDADAHFGIACNGREKGVFAEYVTDNGKDVYYKYGDIAPTKADYLAWTHARRHMDPDAPRLKQLHFWRLEVMSVVRVERDDAFLAQMLPQVSDVWQRVLRFRDAPDDGKDSLAAYLATHRQQQQSAKRGAGTAATSRNSQAMGQKKTVPTTQETHADAVSDELGDFAFLQEE